MPSFRIIDLTLTLRPGMRGVETEPKFLYERDGWNASTLHLYSHCGTHMDAQVHFEAGLGTIDQIPLERCMGPAWVVNLSGITPKGLIEIASLGDAAQRFQPGESLLLRTDWSKKVDNPAIYRDGLPRVSEALATWCVEKQVRLLGVEPPSVADVNNKPEVTLIHKILLGGSVTIVEGLCNLGQLTGPRVFFAALPLKFAAGDGCPCRAFAVDGADAVEPLTRLLA
jgi:arylformamidase